MSNLEMLVMLEAEFVLLHRLARSNPIYVIEDGKRNRRSLAKCVIVECDATLQKLRSHIADAKGKA